MKRYTFYGPQQGEASDVLERGTLILFGVWQGLVLQKVIIRPVPKPYLDKKQCRI